MYIDLKLTEEAKDSLLTLGRQVIDPTVLQYVATDDNEKILSIALAKVVDHVMTKYEGFSKLVLAPETPPASNFRVLDVKGRQTKKAPAASTGSDESKKIPGGLTLTAYALKCLNEVADRKDEFTTRDVLNEMGVMTRGTRTVVDGLIRNAISEGSLTVMGVTGNTRHLKKVSPISVKNSTPPDESDAIERIRGFVFEKLQKNESVTIAEISKFIGVGRNGIKYRVVSDAILPLVNDGILRRTDATWPAVYVSGPKFVDSSGTNVS